MPKNIDISIDLEAGDLAKELELLSEEMTQELKNQIENVAHAAYAQIVVEVQTKLGGTRAEYLKSLSFDRIGDDFIISLEGDWPNMIEEGFGSYDLRETLLNSNKTVKVGSRAGEPWVRTSKAGHRYAAVPFSHKPSSKAPEASSLADAIKKLKSKNAEGRSQLLTRVFKDPSGNPLQGKVASIKETGHPLLDGITKYQKTYKNAKGKDVTSSLYMTYRFITDNPDYTSNWIHPGYNGLHAFEEAEKMIREEIAKIIADFTGE